jgi:toxin ParE1/3/4
MGQEIIWSTEAFDDLESIHRYISRDSRIIASEFVQEILDAIDRLSDFPLSGPRIREWKQSPYRHIIVSPYRIIYRPEKDAVFLIAIVHGARDLKKFLRGRRK